MITLKRTHWGHSDYIFGYFLKELSMSGSGSWWIHCNLNCERTQKFHFKCSHSFPCWVLFKSDQHVPTDYRLIKVEFSFFNEFSLYPLDSGWINCLKNQNEITMCPLGIWVGTFKKYPGGIFEICPVGILVGIL